MSYSVLLALCAVASVGATDLWHTQAAVDYVQESGGDWTAVVTAALKSLYAVCNMSDRKRESAAGEGERAGRRTVMTLTSWGVGGEPPG